MGLGLEEALVATIVIGQVPNLDLSWMPAGHGGYDFMIRQAYTFTQLLT